MNLLDTASLVVTPNGYKASKLYSIVPSDGTGDMTFARTGDTATRVNSSGLIETVLANKPRLDYLGSTCPKLLLEPQRTNLYVYSNTFSDASWVKTESSISANIATTLSPDGTQNASKLIDTVNNNEHRIRLTPIEITGDTTFSIFAKSSNYGKFSIYNASDGYATIFDLNLGTVVSTGTGMKNATIVNYGNGWYRISVTSNGITGFKAFAFALINDSGNISFAGNGNYGVFIYGAQAEAGSYATSYIPTTTASVTRNEDHCVKTSATALIGQTEGTIFADVNYDNVEAQSMFLLGDTSSAGFIYILRTSTGNIVLDVYDSYTGQASITKTGNNYGRFKIAVGYKANDFVMYINGVLIGTDTSGVVPATSIVRFESSAAATSYTQKPNTFALWKTRLTNQELITLTTI